jgi:hypothetical protein
VGVLVGAAQPSPGSDLSVPNQEDKLRELEKGTAPRKASRIPTFARALSLLVRGRVGEAKEAFGPSDLESGLARPGFLQCTV